MKKLFIIPIIVLMLAGCKLSELNENPNVPSAVPLETLLPPVFTSMSTAYGGRAYRYSNIFTNHMRGTSNQELQTDRYNVDEGFVGRLWEGLYGRPMINLKTIIQQAELENSPHYSGVAKVLMANCLGTLTVLWGDVPYSEALQVVDFPNPKFDNQEDVYNAIQELLNQAIQELDASESVKSPSFDDLVYNGNREQWKKAARSLKARYYLHLTKKNSSAASLALTELTFGILDSSDDLSYNPIGISTDLNPLYAFFADSPYMIVDPDFLALMNGLTDPRTPHMFAIIPFTGGQRRPSDYFASPSSRVPFISHIEMLFIRAEAEARLGNTSNAQNALADAIRESIQKISNGAVSQEVIEDYVLAQTALNGNLEHDLNLIITQKYIALFTQVEPWTDFRRTGFPELTPNDPGVSGLNPNGQIPRRLPYPQSERLNNSNFPSPQPNMQDRFWWDQ
jgi:hypothetical protein